MAPLPHFGRRAGMLARLGAGGRSDVFYLYAARAARGFGDGFAAIILPAYLLELGLQSVRDRHRGNRCASRLGRHDLGDRVPGAALRRAHAASGLRGLDGRHRDRDPECPAPRFHRRDCIRRHDESDHRRHRGAYPARTGVARARRVGQGPDARIRALQPGRRAVHRGRRARRGRAGLAGLRREWTRSARCRRCSTSMPHSAWWEPCSIRGFPTPRRR